MPEVPPVRPSRRFHRLRLLAQWMRDRRAGRSKRFPWRTLLAAVFFVLYLLSPIDVIPDLLIPVVGWIDDASMLGVVRWALGRDLRRYVAETGGDPAAHGL